MRPPDRKKSRMSLFQFHIILILASILFGTGFGFWEMAHYAGSLSRVDLGTGIASFVLAAGLAVYLVWFVRRLKK